MTKQMPPLLSGALPLLGHVLEFGKNRGKLFKRGFAEHGKAFSFKIGPKRAVVLIGPEFQREIYQQTDKKLDMASSYKFMKPLFGSIFFIGDHATYRNQRPLLQEPFKREKMAGYLLTMQNVVQNWLNTLGESGRFELTTATDKVVKEVAGRTFFGEDFQEQLGEDFWRNYAVLGKALDPILPPNLPLPRFIRRNRAKKRIQATLSPIIAERRRNPDRYHDFLQDFIFKPCEDGSLVSEEEIVGMLTALLFAGHETTAGQAAWTVIQLLQNPSYLALVQTEMDQNLQPQSLLDPKSLSSLKHLFYAIDETSRTRPSADINVRTPIEDFEIGEFCIPKGVPIFTAAEVAQFLPEIFTEPDRYDPLRFSRERREDKKCPYSMIAFGGGVHRCTGMNFARNEMAIIAGLLLSQYDLKLEGPEPEISRKLGANRPSETWVSYRKKSQKVSVGQKTAAAGCPFHAKV